MSIVGMNVPETSVETVLRQLNASKYTFQLTGSRYFATGNGNSDYDLFVQYHNETTQFLHEMGFDPIADARSKYSYIDREIILVLRHNSLPIDIQLVKDFHIKNLAQIIIKGMNLGEKIKKFTTDTKGTHDNMETRQRTWQRAYKLARETATYMIRLMESNPLDQLEGK